MSVRRLADVSVQPKEFSFTPDNLAWAKKQIEKYPEGRQASAVIPLLWRAQEQAGGWVSEAAIRYVADFLGMAHIRVLEVATFYTQFQLAPVGRKAHVQVCGTTPCMLRGSEDIKRVCRERIHPEPFHVSADGDFSWEEVECLGACVNAPMALIWDDTYEDLTPENFGKVLDGFASGKPVKPGPQIDRQFSAPEGGATTLTDPSIYTVTTPKGGKSLTDDRAKTQGAVANVRESPVPKPPLGGGSGKSKV
jgi:NADH-quinone oxidoreductase subunit E